MHSVYYILQVIAFSIKLVFQNQYKQYLPEEPLATAEENLPLCN